jgi:hypothetical protein
LDLQQYRISACLEEGREARKKGRGERGGGTNLVVCFLGGFVCLFRLIFLRMR